MSEDQPWRWDEATWRPHVEHVRAGWPLRRSSWPGGTRVGVPRILDLLARQHVLGG